MTDFGIERLQQQSQTAQKPDQVDKSRELAAENAEFPD